jgi:hypothetical protein
VDDLHAPGVELVEFARGQVVGVGRR